jgi:hypothetical protein
MIVHKDVLWSTRAFIFKLDCNEPGLGAIGDLKMHRRQTSNLLVAVGSRKLHDHK